MVRRACLAMLGLALAMPSLAEGQPLRAAFTTGVPAGWTLTGTGRWAGKGRGLAVTGTGDDMSYWSRPATGLKPHATYQMRFEARVAPGSSTSTVVSGLDVCNRDFGVTDRWQPYAFVFTTPEQLPAAFVRLGQWHLRGTVEFASASVTPVIPVYRHAGALVLGAGERTDGRSYQFAAPLGGYGSNSARVLVANRAAFNSNRWVLTGGSEVVYQHALPAAQTSARVTVNVNYHDAGECVVSASRDDGDWTEVARLGGVGARTIDLPPSLFPARSIRVRLRGGSAGAAAGNSAPGAFQVDRYAYQARLERALPRLAGATRYLRVTDEDPRVAVHIDDLGSLGTGGDDRLRLTLTPAGAGAAGDAFVTLTLHQNGRNLVAIRSAARLAGKPVSLAAPYRWARTGPVQGVLSVALVGKAGARFVFVGSFDDTVPTYYAADYGYPIGRAFGGALWWCESTYKIQPARRPPTGSDAPRGSTGGTGIRLAGAGRERVAAQLVLRPARDVGPIAVRPGDLRGPGGARIPAAAVRVRTVEYVDVRTPTDSVGMAGEWPDPLPPLAGAWRPRPGRNNPLWITVTVPAGARPGDYDGTLALVRGRQTLPVRLRLHVWGFSLPERSALRSGFGLDPGNIQRYHNLKSAGSTAKVWGLYLRDFAEHRLCTYNPMALAPFRTEVTGVHWNGGQRDNTHRASGAWSLHIVDDRADRAVEATTADLMPVLPGRDYRLFWSVMTARAGQAYEVSVGCYDGARQWIAYHNIDIQRTGSGTWQSESLEIGGRLPAQARFVSIALRPCPWSEKGDATGEAWFDDVGLAGGPGGTDLVKGGGFEQEPRPELRIDFAEFDRAARRYLDGLGFNAFTISFPGLGGGRHPSYDNGSIGGYPAGTREYDMLMRQFGRQLEDYLKQNGWLDRAYVYWYDEPEVNDYPFVIQGMRRLKEYAPGLKRMLTEEFQPQLYGYVDLWCPITPNYAPGPAAARQKAGEEVWWYVCTGPKEPYCTLFIDHPAIEMRMWLWQTWKYRVQGILIWDTTWWTSPQQFTGDRVQNPWDDPMSYVADASGVWGNGDGRFFYPPNRRPNDDRTTEYLAAPIDSLRWELLGEGVQDWEYFHLLDGLVRAAEGRGDRSAAVRRAKALLVVPQSICRDMTHFTTDPQLLYRHRERLARAIEALRQSK